MRRVLRLLFSLIGAGLGIGFVSLLRFWGVLDGLSANMRIALLVIGGLVGYLLLFAVSKPLASRMKEGFDTIYSKMEVVPLTEVLIGTGGLVIGLIVAGLVSRPVLALSVSYVGNSIGVLIAVLIYVFFGVLGIRIALRNREEIKSLFSQLKHSDEEKRQSKKEKKSVGERDKAGKALPKILDTSVIIDGRIFQVIQTGFLEGPFVITHYVLEELQYISDSSDALRRERGRRGLDRVHNLQEEVGDQVIVDDSVIRKAKEVDAKLLILTKHYQGAIVTNDYNLNKVATVQEIPVLNVNDLANALKPVLIPGDELDVQIIREGSQPGQGLGYLSDGTMIVIEDGEKRVGDTVHAAVTSVYQTSAGKMIFAKIVS